VVLGIVAVIVVPATAGAGDEIDLDLWHRELAAAIGEEPEVERDGRWALGLFPTLGASVGPPNWISCQGAFSLSLYNGRRISLVAGVGFELGPEGSEQSVTIGWGGVRPIPGEAPQLGFHSKFLRYQRWDHNSQGMHHGLSVGTEHGIGNYAVSFEIGAARSSKDHWLIIAEFSLKLAAPVHISLGGGGER
jgi:hypothetical protein